MNKKFKRSAISLLFVFLVVIHPTITLANGSAIKDWLMRLDKAAEQKYWNINNTFLGNILLDQGRQLAPALITIGAMVVAMQWAMKQQAKNLASHSVQPVVVTDTTLADYAGTIPPAVLTLIDQIKNRETYKKVNAPVTKGVLLTGLPGTGKSFLARAIAGTVDCVFIATSATEFSQPFLGSSEAMIRDVFNSARTAAAEHSSKLAIIFIDEIDALASRGAAFAGGAPIGILQTFLTEMDGFNKTVIEDLPWYKKIFVKPQSIDVVVLAATNAPQNLDPALKRKGRFDHIIEVKNPDKDGRRAIAALYLKKYPHDKNINPDSLAQLTDEMTPADLNALFAEAARDAGSKKQTVLSIANFCYALVDAKKNNFKSYDDIITIFYTMYPCDKTITKTAIQTLFADPKMLQNISIVFDNAYKNSQTEGRSTISKNDLMKFVK